MLEPYQPKTQEISLLERERMMAEYHYHTEAWQNRVQRGLNIGEEYVPLQLSDTFALVERCRSWRQDEPNFYFTFLSNFGYIILDIWSVDLKHHTVLSSIEMYTQGLDGTIRGKGKDAMEAVGSIMQTLADTTGYTILDIVTTNVGSAPLVDKQNGNGFVKLTDERRKKIHKRHVSPADEQRWKSLMDLNPVFVKEYSPSQEIQSTSFEEELIAPIVNMLKLSPPVGESSWDNRFKLFTRRLRS